MQLLVCVPTTESANLQLVAGRMTPEKSIGLLSLKGQNTPPHAARWQRTEVSKGLKVCLSLCEQNHAEIESQHPLKFILAFICMSPTSVRYTGFLIPNQYHTCELHHYCAKQNIRWMLYVQEFVSNPDRF